MTAGSKGPLTCAVLLMQLVRQGQLHAARTGWFSRALTPGYRAMNIMMAAGGCSAGRIGVTSATPDPDGG